MNNIADFVEYAIIEAIMGEVCRFFITSFCGVMKMPKEKVSYTKPFLRWAGGKSWLIKHLDQIIGEQVFNNYHEPFLGGGSMLDPKKRYHMEFDAKHESYAYQIQEILKSL